jgi:hypothetical protein
MAAFDRVVNRKTKRSRDNINANDTSWICTILGKLANEEKHKGNKHMREGLGSTSKKRLLLYVNRTSRRERAMTTKIGKNNEINNSTKRKRNC